MEKPDDVLDKYAEKSLAEDQSIQDWLGWLMELRDQVETAIENAQRDIEDLD